MRARTCRGECACGCDAGAAARSGVPRALEAATKESSRRKRSSGTRCRPMALPTCQRGTAQGRYFVLQGGLAPRSVEGKRKRPTRELRNLAVDVVPDEETMAACDHACVKPCPHRANASSRNSAEGRKASPSMRACDLIYPSSFCSAPNAISSPLPSGPACGIMSRSLLTLSSRAWRACRCTGQ